jgi:hypothetical protein
MGLCVVARGKPPADGRRRAGFGAGLSGKSGIQPGRFGGALPPDLGVLWFRFTHDSLRFQRAAWPTLSRIASQH